MTGAAISLWAVLVAAAMMILEWRISSRHATLLLRRGAVEPPDPVYPAMQAAYPGAFLAMAAEGWLRAAAPGWATAVGVVVFTGAKLLKFWAMASLGTRWTFRILVLPGEPLISIGPYAWMRHPNYAAVVGELIGYALVTGAFLAGPSSIAVFGWLLLGRIEAEERALGLR